MTYPSCYTIPGLVEDDPVKVHFYGKRIGQRDLIPDDPTSLRIIEECLMDLHVHLILEDFWPEGDKQMDQFFEDRFKPAVEHLMKESSSGESEVIRLQIRLDQYLGQKNFLYHRYMNHLVSVLFQEILG